MNYLPICRRCGTRVSECGFTIGTEPNVAITARCHGQEDTRKVLMTEFLNEEFSLASLKDWPFTPESEKPSNEKPGRKMEEHEKS